MSRFAPLRRRRYRPVAEALAERSENLPLDRRRGVEHAAERTVGDHEGPYGETVVTLAVRGSFVMSEISPKKSPSPSVRSFRLP